MRPYDNSDDRWARCIRRGVVVGTAITLTALVVPRAHGVEAPIAVSVAPLFVGEEKVVEGVVTAVDKDVNVVTLQLGTPPHAVEVSVIIGLLTRFPTNPEVYYAGKTVRVAGMIEKFRDGLEMTIRNPANIEVVDFDSARADPKLREEQEAMRARVQSLEERIRQLEASQRQTEHPPE
jgi:hypothetical protein